MPGSRSRTGDNDGTGRRPPAAFTPDRRRGWLRGRDGLSPSRGHRHGHGMSLRSRPSLCCSRSRRGSSPRAGSPVLFATRSHAIRREPSDPAAHRASRHEPTLRPAGEQLARGGRGAEQRADRTTVGARPRPRRRTAARVGRAGRADAADREWLPPASANDQLIHPLETMTTTAVSPQSPGGCRSTNPPGPVPTVLHRGPVAGGLGGLPSPAAVSR